MAGANRLDARRGSVVGAIRRVASYPCLDKHFASGASPFGSVKRNSRIARPVLETTIAGSLPKPSWLAEPRKLWAAWRLDGEALAEGKRDATLLALKVQGDCGIAIV